LADDVDLSSRVCEPLAVNTIVDAIAAWSSRTEGIGAPV